MNFQAFRFGEDWSHGASVPRAEPALLLPDTGFLAAGLEKQVHRHGYLTLLLGSDSIPVQLPQAVPLLLLRGRPPSFLFPSCSGKVTFPGGRVDAEQVCPEWEAESSDLVLGAQPRGQQSRCWRPGVDGGLNLGPWCPLPSGRVGQSWQW